MPVEIWGAIGALTVIWPETISGWLLLLCYLIFFIALLAAGRASFSRLSVKQWFFLVILSVLALLLSQLFPLLIAPEITKYLPHFSVDDQAVTISLISATPYLLTAAILGNGPALIVGLITGFGYAIGQTHQLYTPFHYAFAAYLAAQLMGQCYQGRFYRWLRIPLVGGIIGQISTAVFAAVVALVNSTGLLASADAALATFQAQLWSVLIVGLVSGTFVTILVHLMSQWLPRRRLVPTPSQRSVRSFLLTNFLIFAGVVLFFSAIFVFGLSVFVSSRALVTQIAARSNTASEQLEDFQSELAQLLDQSGRDEDLSRADRATAARALGRLYRNAEHFQQVILVDDQLSEVSRFPLDGSKLTLAEAEREAADRAVEDGLKTTVMADVTDQGQNLSLIIPVQTREGDESRVLIGRVRPERLSRFLDELPALDGSGFITDRGEQLFAADGHLEAAAEWSNPETNGAQGMFVPAYLGGKAFLIGKSDRSRDIHYVTPPNKFGWRVVATVPYDDVLNQAFASALPIVLFLLAVTGLFYGRFATYGQQLVGPIKDLSRASRAIIAGDEIDVPIDVSRQDELGDLGRSFTSMQSVLKGRLNELSLLLSVSQDVSTSVNIYESMPVILQGALRGTGAAGARVVILNPSGRMPLSFAEGPAGSDMSVIDRTLMAALRNESELSIGSSREMRQLLTDSAKVLPVKALYAITLQLQNEFTGIFFLGYRDPRDFASSEKHLLHTLAGQATLLVENAHLYATAEGGRQRLRAVLSSTSEAVLVTDQTDRILLLNKAMEQAFHLSSNEAIGRVVGDVVQSPQLMGALLQSRRGLRNLEVLGKDGRTYLANVSTIVGGSRQVMGRVAVLHDVTQLREVDRMKSEFVSNVTHDLKTPLTIISGYASALVYTENLSDEQKEIADNILLGVDRMAKLVDNLLDLGRLEAGIALVMEKFRAEDLLTELVDDHWMHAHNNGVQLRVKVAKDLPQITADRAWLYQAISNLLSNGFKYAPNSGEMILSAVHVGNNAVISLHDKGPGIASNQQADLFEKFFRVDKSKDSEVKGTGLGLAIVKSVTERHGGQVWCQSELGKGSTFSISVPIEGVGNTRTVAQA